MTFGQFEIKLNNYILIEFINTKRNKVPTEKYPWLILSIKTPTISLPFYRKNELGELERSLSISVPTVFEWLSTNDIYWQFHIRILGFGIIFSSQFGY